MILIVPSRGRPERALTMLQSAQRTASHPVTVIICVDPDDPELERYRELVPGVRVLDERIGYSGTLNLVAAENWAGNEILGAFGDDVVFGTIGWDDRIRDTLHTPGIAYGNDLFFGDGHPTAVFMSSQVARALGWLALPVCRHQYVDDGWKAVGQELGILRYRADVVVEHVHPAYGKGEMDDTYREVYSEPQATLDFNEFNAWKLEGLHVDVARARAAL